MRLSLTLEELEARFVEWRDMPQRIERASRDAWDAKQRITALQQEIDERRWTLEYDIRTDKAKYPNEASRELAIKQAMAADEGVQTRLREIAEWEEIKMRNERLQWTLKDEATILKYHIRASVAVLEGLADPVVREIINGERKAA